MFATLGLFEIIYIRILTYQVLYQGSFIMVNTIFCKQESQLCGRVLCILFHFA